MAETVKSIIAHRSSMMFIQAKEGTLDGQTLTIASPTCGKFSENAAPKEVGSKFAVEYSRTENNTVTKVKKEMTLSSVTGYKPNAKGGKTVFKG